MKKYSWINLKQDFGSLSEDDCIISLDIRTSKFSLEFLFPRKNWIFLNKNEDLNHLTRQCKGTLYYFNPVPYGLEEETDKLVFTEWEGMLKKQYCFKKINDITLYELKERKEK